MLGVECKGAEGITWWPGVEASDSIPRMADGRIESQSLLLRLQSTGSAVSGLNSFGHMCSPAIGSGDKNVKRLSGLRWTRQRVEDQL